LFRGEGKKHAGLCPFLTIACFLNRSSKFFDKTSVPKESIQALFHALACHPTKNCYSGDRIDNVLRAGMTMLNILSIWPSETFRESIPVLLHSVELFNSDWRDQTRPLLKATYTSAFIIIAPKKCNELPYHAVHSLYNSIIMESDGMLLNMMEKVMEVLKSRRCSKRKAPPQHLISLLIKMLYFVKENRGRKGKNGWKDDKYFRREVGDEVRKFSEFQGNGLSVDISRRLSVAILKTIDEDIPIAFCMARHKRIGEDSAFHELPVELFSVIFDFL